MVEREDSPAQLEYGRSMPPREKIEGFLAEARRQGIGRWTAAPPIVRLSWRLKLDVPPPVYWSFATNALVYGGAWAAIFLILALPDGQWPREFIAALGSATFFGLWMASSNRRLARRLRVSPWDGGHAPR
jgi:hypothetical protein